MRHFDCILLSNAKDVQLHFASKAERECTVKERNRLWAVIVKGSRHWDLIVLTNTGIPPFMRRLPEPTRMLRTFLDFPRSNSTLDLTIQYGTVHDLSKDIPSSAKESEARWHKLISMK